MQGIVRRGVRRDLTLLVSGALVLVTGFLGLLAGDLAGRQAIDVHREDRVQLQLQLAGLVEQHSQIIGAEVVDRLAADPAWGTAPADPSTTARLQELVSGSRSLDFGALLLGPAAQPLAGWTRTGDLPDADDPGWEPLRAAVRAAEPGVLPLSGVLDVGDRHVLALALPVALTDGSQGLLVGLWEPSRGTLQQYVSSQQYGATGRGYLVDAEGLVLAAPRAAEVGERLGLPALQAAMASGSRSGILDTGDGRVVSYAVAGSSGWTVLTSQSRDEFQGALERSSRLVSAAVVALIVAAGTGLVVLHHKRETALQVVALRDELTGLYNRRGWFVLAGHELERARRQSSARILLFVDLDGLKQINDALGHREGDRAIADAAAVLLAASRGSDLVGRLGGDEFVLLLGDDGHAGAARRRLLDALEVHNARSDASFELRLSVGSEVWFPDEACTLDELVRRADADMYAHKQSRTDRVVGLLRERSTGEALAASGLDAR